MALRSVESTGKRWTRLSWGRRPGELLGERCAGARAGAARAREGRRALNGWVGPWGGLSAGGLIVGHIEGEGRSLRAH